MSENPPEAARDRNLCEGGEPHHWVAEHVSGHILYWVHQCDICHRVNWDELDNEVAAYRAKLVTDPVDWNTVKIIDCLLCAVGGITHKHGDEVVEP